MLNTDCKNVKTTKIPGQISGIFHHLRSVGRVEEEGRRVVHILDVDAHRGRVIAHRVPRVLRLQGAREKEDILGTHGRFGTRRKYNSTKMQVKVHVKIKD